jgi:hypothetical protein
MIKVKILNEKDGSDAYENWRDWNEAKNENALNNWITSEYPLFSDAWVTGGQTQLDSPYIFINMVPVPKDDVVVPVLVLRISESMGGPIEIPPVERTAAAHYHGGTILDEISSLLCLEMGIRLKPGKIIRVFFPLNDPKGNPRAFEMIPDIVTPKIPSRPIVPNARGNHPIPNNCLLFRFLELKPEDSVILVRASRLYQDAIWICESQPALAWLLFVSAIETAADYWKKEESEIKKLLDFWPSARSDIKDNKLLTLIAEKVACSLGSTRKFREFVLHFIPDPPSVRPPDWAQILWTKNELKKVLNTIYGHRSKALHEGRTFPHPMCLPPTLIGGVPEEKLHAISVRLGNSTWLQKDFPMNLNIFEYIVRNVLLSWWRSMLPPS